MRRSVSLVVGLVLVLGVGTARAASGWPYPWIEGNDTGGIIPYSPGIENVYRQMAAGHCARWGRLSHVTSVHRRYGDYISFACIDKPWMIH